MTKGAKMCKHTSVHATLPYSKLPDESTRDLYMVVVVRGAGAVGLARMTTEAPALLVPVASAAPADVRATNRGATTTR